ncbi:hypothetical protein KI387_018787, partial [Taxus chinensis]
MEMESSAALSKSLAVAACTAMALTYVGLLYAPRFILRLPPPASLNEHMLRRFFSVGVSSIIALVMATLLLLPVWDSGKTHITSILGAYGLKIDHLWQAVCFPLVLTALLYLGPLVTAALETVCKWKQEQLPCACGVVDLVNSAYRDLVNAIHEVLSMRSDILAWRNYVVAPLTEELVFRACMIPLLLCGGFQPYSIVFLCPVFFSLAHLNHFWELYYQQNYDICRAAVVVGFQLVYTVIFGWYASFLFIRTGHLVAPIMAHIFCNITGLPSMSCVQRGKVTTMVFLAGIAGFFLVLAPATNPVLYNDSIASCKCWYGFCKLKSDLQDNY